MPSDLHQNIFILSGPVHSGKTTFLSGVAEMLRKEMVPMAGFICEGTFSNNRRSSFTLVNLDDLSRHLLATFETRNGWIPFGPFYFNPEAIAEGEEVVRKGLENATGVVVLDEVGPLELKGDGWSSLLNSLVMEYRLAQIWVVREKILGEVLARWRISPDCVTHVNPGEEYQFVHRIIDYVRKNESSKDL